MRYTVWVLKVPVLVDTHLRIDGNMLGHDLTNIIFDELTIPNHAREDAQVHGRWGWWKLPEFFEMFDLDGDELVLPRGYALRLKQLLREYDKRVSWDDRRRWKLGEPYGPDEFEFRIHQPDAIDSIKRHQQGIYKAPTGCVDGDTMLHFNRAGKGFSMKIADAYKKFNGIKQGTSGPAWRKDIPTFCRALCGDVFQQHLVEDIVCSGLKPTIVITLESGKQLRCTRGHGILRDEGWVAAGSLVVGNWVAVNGIKKGAKYVPAPEGHHRAIMVGHSKAPKHGYVLESVLVSEKKYGRKILATEHVHHKDENPLNNHPDNLEVLTPGQHNQVHRRFRNMDEGVAGNGGRIVFLPKYERVVSIEEDEFAMTYDMVMADPHNNFVANGIVVHNSGKTVTMIGVLWELHPQRALVLVERLNLLDQWKRRIHDHLGSDVPVGIIGDGKWNVERITIATAQTLYRYRDETRFIELAEKTDALIIDECHHATAKTINELIQLFPAKLRVGTSATPDKTGEFDLALNVIGEVFYEDDEEELREVGLIVKPHVEVIHTNFVHEFWGDHKATREDDYICDVPGCKKSGKEPHVHKGNYQQVKQALIRDAKRNRLIADNIIANRGHCQIVITNETTHIDEMLAALEKRDPRLAKSGLVHVITGRSKKNRDEVIQQLEDMQEFILFSTVAAEGLDIARIDRVHLPFPERNPRTVEQKIGRGTRSFDGKLGSIIFDYADVLVPPLAKQFRERRWKCYEVLGLPVNIRGE